MFSPIRLCREGADPGAGAGGTSTATDPKLPDASLVTPEDLKKYGFDSKEQMDAFFTQHNEKKPTAEEIQAQENQKKASLIKYAADNNFMKVDEFTRLESIKAKSDKDLVFENFSKEYLADDLTATEDQIKKAFDDMYGLASENPTIKKIGEKQLSKDASSIRSPLEKSFEAAQKRYNEDETTKSKIPGFDKALKETIEKLTPAKLVLFKTKDGEDEIPVEVELTDKERKEVFDTFRNPKTMNKFLSKEGKVAEFEAEISKKIQSVLRNKYWDYSNEKSFELGKGRGLKGGSNVGATQPFSVIAGRQFPGGSDKKGTGDKEVADNDLELRRRLKGTR